MGGAIEHAFTLEGSGEAWAALTLDAPGTSWARAAAAVVTLRVDGHARQEVILAGGDEPTEYLRLLGRLPRGTHVLQIAIDPDLSARGVQTVLVSGVRIGVVEDTDRAAFVWRHAPVLHYRALQDLVDSLTTDTPLLLFYRILTGGPDVCGEAAAQGRTSPSRGTGAAVEYHVVFSHEDAGTDLTGLLARWGHTVDIEWIYRVTCDGAGRVINEEFQAPDHATARFRGARAMGGHAVLQVATLNGMVTDRVTCPFRAALAPACAQPAGEPREGVLHQFPWIYRVSALEVVRQVPLDPDSSHDSPAGADPRSYLYLQWKRRVGPAVPLEASVYANGTRYASAWGRADLAFAEPDGESTAVKIPRETTEAQITGIALRALEPPPVPLEIHLVRAFFLDEHYRPRSPLAANGICRLTTQTPQALVWERPREGWNGE
jgi:hypothetical protein